MTQVYRAVSSIIVRRLPFKDSTKLNPSSSIKDVNRRPTELLYLLVKKPRKHHAWQFPQGGQDEGESASDAAMRELEEECGSDLKAKLIDSTSIGQYQYKFPPDFKKRNKSIGAKVSFFRADYLQGNCQPDGKEIIDFAWLTKEELQEYIHAEYKKAIEVFLN